MSESEDYVERLRAALRALGEGARPGEDCPRPERLWAALRAELPAEDRRAIVDHIATCPSCAEAWQLAIEIHPGPIPLPAPSPWWRGMAVPDFAALAAAAAVVLAVGAGVFVLRTPRPSVDPGYREAGRSAIRSLVAEDVPLPADGFRLRWSHGPEGSRYDVRVTTESLVPVASAQGLTEPEFLVSPSSLASLSPGTRLLWQVQMRLPDGERRGSATFITALR